MAQKADFNITGTAGKVQAGIILPPPQTGPTHETSTHTVGAAIGILDTLRVPELREIAKKENADIKGLQKKVDIIAAIKTART